MVAYSTCWKCQAHIACFSIRLSNAILPRHISYYPLVHFPRLVSSNASYCPTYLVVVEEEGDWLSSNGGFLEENLQVLSELHLDKNN